MLPRVCVSAAAEVIIKQLRHSYGDILFHLSGGCCDGSAPSCLPIDDFMINDSDVLLGKLVECDFYMSKSQFEYMRYSQVTIDVIEGKGSAFSLEIPLGYRFVTKSRIIEEADDVLTPAFLIKASGKVPES